MFRIKKLVCLTNSLFSDKCYSLSSHLFALIRCLVPSGEYGIIVLSFDTKCTLNEEQVLDNFGCANLRDSVFLFSLNHLAPERWAQLMIDADIVLCQHYAFAEILQAVKRHKPEMKIISWIHSVVQEEYLSGAIRYRNDAYPLIRQQNLQVRLTDICVFDSKYDEERGQLDFSGMKASRVIPLVTELEAYRPRSAEKINSLFNNGSLRLQDVQLLYVGRWDYRKGLDSLMPCSFRMYMEHGVKTVLLAVENEDAVFSDSAARRQFNALRACGGLRFEAWKLKKTEYAAFLTSQRWVVVIPSYYDPFNLGALDCAVLNLPIVVSNRCGVVEILKEDEGLSIVNPYYREELYQKVLSLCQAARLPLPEHLIANTFSDFEDKIIALFHELDFDTSTDC